MRFELKQIPGSRYYYVYWSEKGRSRRVSTRQTDRKAAEQFLSAFKNSYDPNAERAWHLIDVLDFYYDFHAKDLATADDARASINRLKAYYGACDTTDIDKGQQEDFIRHRRRDGVSNDTVNRDLSALSAALRYAADRKKITQPYKVWFLEKNEPRERFLSRTEVALLYAYMWWNIKQTKRNHHVLLFTRLMINTGARPSAILELTWDRVDFARGLIHYDVPGKRKTNKRRSVTGFDHKLRSALKAEIKRQLKYQAKRKKEKPEDNWKPSTVIMFNGKPVTQSRKTVVKALKAIGINDASPYTLRHTFATWASTGGAPLAMLSKAMAHSSTNTTMRYIKFQPAAFREVVRASRKKLKE